MILSMSRRWSAELLSSDEDPANHIPSGASDVFTSSVASSPCSAPDMGGTELDWGSSELGCGLAVGVAVAFLGLPAGGTLESPSILFLLNKIVRG
jgi:hypothetical protein